MTYARAVLVAIAFAAPTLASAAVQSFEEAMGTITLRAAFSAWALSTVFSLASLFYRVDRELRRTGRPLANPGTFALANVFGGWSAGALAWISGEALGAPGMGIAVSIMVSSFGGGAWLEKIAEKRLGVTFDLPQPPTQLREP